MQPLKPWPVRVFTPIGRVLLIGIALLFVIGGYAFFEYLKATAEPGDQFYWLPFLFGVVAGCGVIWTFLAWALERAGIAVFNRLDDESRDSDV